MTLRELGRGIASYFEDFQYSVFNRDFLDWQISHILLMGLLLILTVALYEAVANFFSSPSKGARVGRKVLWWSLGGFVALVVLFWVVGGPE